MKDVQTTIINLMGIDKMLHLGYGGWISAYGTTWYWQIVIAFCAGVIKELIDVFIRKKRFSTKDLLATTTGGIINALINISL